MLSFVVGFQSSYIKVLVSLFVVIALYYITKIFAEEEGKLQMLCCIAHLSVIFLAAIIGVSALISTTTLLSRDFKNAQASMKVAASNQVYELAGGKDYFDQAIDGLKDIKDCFNDKGVTR